MHCLNILLFCAMPFFFSHQMPLPVIQSRLSLFTTMYLLCCTYYNVYCKLSIIIISSLMGVVLLYLETLGERMIIIYTYSM